MSHRWLAAAGVGLAVLMSCGAARGQYIPFTKPAKTRLMRSGERQRVIGYEYGNPLHGVQIFNHNPRRGRPGINPLRVNHEFRPQNVTTLKQWRKARERIRRRVVKFFGELPPMDLPLEPKVEKEDDHGDYLVRIVSLQFDKRRRVKAGVMIPKGYPAPGPAVLVYGSYDVGIDKITKGVYSRTVGVHLVRQGVVVVALQHMYDEFGKSTTLNTTGAAAHNVRRVVSYLRTQKDLVRPEQIGLFGHVYGAELGFFILALEDRIAAYVAAGSQMGPTAPYTAAFWGPPFWCNRGWQGMGGASSRAQPKMFISGMNVSIRPLPFLTQELMALAAPRPLMAMNHGIGYGGKTANNGGIECVRPVWELYGKPVPIELAGHKLDTNLPANARNHITSFFLRAMAGVNPGHAGPEKVREILQGLKSPQPAARLRACRLAAWWECAQAKDQLLKLLTSKDLTLRRAAAKALERIGAVKELFAHIRHPDPVMRLAVVEAIYLHGADEKTWEAMLEYKEDVDKWVNEAKWQTMELNPYE